MEQYRQLSCHCHDCFLLRVLPTSGGEFQSPSPQIRVFAEWSEDVVRTPNQKSSQHRVTNLRYPKLRISPTRLISSRPETYVRAGQSTLPEPVWIIDH